MKLVLSNSIAITLSILLFSGCGGSDGDTSESISFRQGTQDLVSVTDDDKTLTEDKECAKEYYKAEISSVLKACNACHTEDGVAGSTDLILNKGEDKDFESLKAYLEITGKKIILKNDGSLSHVGGATFTEETNDKFENLIDKLNNPNECRSENDENDIDSIPQMGVQGFSHSVWAYDANSVDEIIQSETLLNSFKTEEILTGSLDTPANIDDEYVHRVQAYITPLVSGEYYFYVAADDGATVWLSTDENNENTKKIIELKRWTSHNNFKKYSEQKSQKIRLEKGQAYYLDIVAFENGGGDNLSLAWSRVSNGQEGSIEVLPANVLQAYTSLSMHNPEPDSSIEPTIPTLPTDPVIPTRPNNPTEPNTPTIPTDPVLPTEPSTPNIPVDNPMEPSTPIMNEDCVSDFYKQEVASLINDCLACHKGSGIASGTKLVFDEISGLDSDKNFESLKTYLLTTGRKIIEKNDGTKGHVGGALFDVSESKTMSIMLEYVSNPSMCKSSDTVAVDTSGIPLASPQATLESVSMLLLNRAPNEQERTQAQSDQGLDNVVDTYMKQAEFYDWVRQSFNNLLLTDGISGGDSINAIRGTKFKDNARWYESFKDDDRDAYNRAKYGAEYGARKAPLELIVNVIKRDRPFSEILTADYMMVNPYSARSYGISGDGFAFENGDDTSKYSKYDYKKVRLEGIPHAGILSDTMFLQKYPTTRTNANRHRSSVVQKLFLNTDIEGLSNRPLKPNETDDNFVHPTMEDPDCTICHVVMEPISGAFKNYRDGVKYTQRTWYENMQKPGFDINTELPDRNSANSLQWLAKEIVKDERFSRSVVHMFYTALTGKEPLTLGAKEASLDLTQALSFENEVFTQVQKEFVNANMNAKVLIKALIKSPLFRGEGLGNTEFNAYIDTSVARSQILSPEALDEKIKNLTGYYWTDRNYFTDAAEQEKNGKRHYLREQYKITYGGIDSKDITQRASDTNALMASLQMRMAVEMGSRIAPIEFFYEKSQRKIFPYVEKDMEPSDEASITKIKQNIKHMYKYLLNEDYELDSPEVLEVYELFVESVRAGQEGILDKSNPSYLRYWIVKDPKTNANLPGDKQIRNDKNWVISSWSLVMTYMLSDYAFLYVSSNN